MIKKSLIFQLRQDGDCSGRAGSRRSIHRKVGAIRRRGCRRTHGPAAGGPSLRVGLQRKIVILIDQNSILFLLLSWPTFPLSENWDDFVEGKKLYSQYGGRIIDFYKNIEFKFVHEVCFVKQMTNLQKYFLPHSNCYSLCALAMTRAEKSEKVPT